MRKKYRQLNSIQFIYQLYYTMSIELKYRKACTWAVSTFSLRPLPSVTSKRKTCCSLYLLFRLYTVLSLPPHSADSLYKTFPLLNAVFKVNMWRGREEENGGRIRTRAQCWQSMLYVALHQTYVARVSCNSCRTWDAYCTSRPIHKAMLFVDACLWQF